MSLSAATVTGNGHAHPFKCVCSLEIYLYLNNAQIISASVAASTRDRFEKVEIGKSMRATLTFDSDDQFSVINAQNPIS
ncbi:MAG: hypothetical protein J0I36_02630 [Pandoraea sp.]|nr:hypothetical protein [Pandoraea sp.]OJY16601.1 MAG: hypothetical protein BGP02_01975 [Pandoraea sp. 64-18]